jgi:hypothetical protein
LAKALTFAQSPPPEAPPVTPPVAQTGHDLVAIENRCVVKADAARWAAQKRRRLAAGASFDLEIEPKDTEIIGKGKEAGAYLWMSTPAGPCPDDPAAMDEVASCFETTAVAIGLMRGVLNESSVGEDDVAHALELLAEAQCMLRTAIKIVGWDRDDPDQLAIHVWLRGATYRHQVYISEFMKETDSASPAGCADLADRISELYRKLEERRSTARKRKNLLGKVRYHLNQIGGGNGKDNDWQKVVASVDELVSMGMPPSSIEIREMLLPYVEDALPDWDFPAGFRLVMREIDRYLASQEQQGRPAKAEATNKSIEQVAKWLNGKSVTLIGGYERPASSKTIKEAFQLKELNWVRSEEHDSVDSFEPDVADPGVVLVILMIRWSSHSYAELQKFCAKHGKPLVRLPGGYGRNQIAHQVIAQCSKWFE